MRIESRRLHRELPVFAVEVDGRHLAYAPGLPVIVKPCALPPLEAALRGGTATNPRSLAERLLARARDAQARWQQLQQPDDDWRCLTLYPSNRCSLDCRYCFAASSRAAAAPRVDEHHAASAAAVVARRAAAAGLPLTVAFHGGGEPTADWPLLMRLVERTRAVAREHGVDWWGYIATHGVIGAGRARRLSREFDAVGLSCDGPPELHDRRRATRGGAPTSAMVVRTAAQLRAAGTPFSVRTTVDADDLDRQPEIVRWVHDELAPGRLAIEPVYRAAAGEALAPEQAEAFADSFWRARRWGREQGLEVETSAVRIDEVHGPYCNALRGVLQVGADGRAQGCFLSTGAGPSTEGPLALAAFDAAEREPVWFAPRIASLRERALQRPPRCWHCFNTLHCAGDCPDRCPAVGETDDQPGFRCRLARALGARAIVERAEPASAPDA